MSCEILCERRRATHIGYKLNFDITNDGGFSFDCDQYGNICDDITDAAKENYQWCLNHPEKFIRKPYVRQEKWSYMVNALAKCSCGEEFELTNEYDGACQCPKCGQWYNLFGQELLDPLDWEEGEMYDDE